MLHYQKNKYIISHNIMLSTLNKTRILLKKNRSPHKRYRGEYYVTSTSGSGISDLLMSGTSFTIAITSIIIISLFYRYKVAGANQYLVRTGWRIPDIKISKQGFQLPFQTYKYISMTPKNYTFDLHSMSSEKIEFLLPGVFTIGPKNDMESLTKYVRILSENEDGGKSFDNIVLGILEGEVRILSSTMTLEEIFKDRQSFKKN